MESAARYRPPKFVAGLDVGKSGDPSALAVMEWASIMQAGTIETRWDCRHLERVPLNISYPQMAKGVRARLEQLKAPCVLVIDATGVGFAVVDSFEEVWNEVHPITHLPIPQEGKPSIVALTSMGGQFAYSRPRAEAWNRWIVPKRDIVFALNMALQQRRFRVAQGLAEASRLFREGQNFQWKVSDAGNDQYEAMKGDRHDDLLLAVAIAVWWGEMYAPTRAPATGQQYATAAASPWRKGIGGQPQAASGMVRVRAR